MLCSAAHVIFEHQLMVPRLALSATQSVIQTRVLRTNRLEFSNLFFYRSFCDVLVMEFANSHPTGHVNKCIDAMNNLIWKYNIIALDRLILCMALRTNEGNEAQVCSYIIQLLLLKPHDFRNRVSELVRNMSPEHWVNGDFYANHMEFHRKFPEKFIYDEQQTFSDPNVGGFHHLPTYFGNVCLRFIPVFDIVVHR